MKRILVLSDFHSGHRVGLTHPSDDISPVKKSSTKREKWRSVRGALWGHFTGILGSIGKIDLCFNLGDATDGKGKRSGGTELLTSDMQEQVDMAVRCMDQVRLYAAKDYQCFGVYGTPYHTAADGDDWDDIFAERAGFDHFGAHEWVEVEGVTFDLKHHIGGSSVPHGKGTQPMKEYLWNQLWAERKLQPKANVILRGHAHNFVMTGGKGWRSIVCPALQGMGSKFGGRRCSGLVDWGLLVIEVDNGQMQIHEHIIDITEQRAKVIKVDGVEDTSYQVYM